MTLLHNMSVPPRTRVVLQGRPVSSKVTIFSLTYAVIASDLVSYAPLGQRFIANILDHAASHLDRVRQRYSTPEELLKAIGGLREPRVPHDFVIGWRPLVQHVGVQIPQMLDDSPAVEVTWTKPQFCRDPRRCAGVLSKCVGTLLLSRRDPCLTWESLLAAPVAFDEPLFPRR